MTPLSDTQHFNLSMVDLSLNSIDPIRHMIGSQRHVIPSNTRGQISLI